MSRNKQKKRNFFSKNRKGNSLNLPQSRSSLESVTIDSTESNALHIVESNMPGTSASSGNDFSIDGDYSASTPCQNAKLEERSDKDEIVSCDQAPESSNNENLASINKDYSAVEKKRGDAEKTVPNNNGVGSTNNEKLPTIKECYNIDETKVTPTSNSNIESVLSFVSDPSSFKSPLLNTILSSLSNPDLTRLYKEYGYNKCNLYFCVIERYVTGIASHNDDDTWICAYTDLNERRMKDMELFNAIETNAVAILSIKKKLNGILKEKANKDLLCLQCKKSMANLLFLPCGHIIMCGKCGKEDISGCKSCGTHVMEVHNIYF